MNSRRVVVCAGTASTPMRSCQVDLPTQTSRNSCNPQADHFCTSSRLRHDTIAALSSSQKTNRAGDSLASKGEEMSTEVAFDVPSFINSRRTGITQYGIVLLCGLVMFLDGFDTQAISYMVPSIAKRVGTSPSSFLDRSFRRR